MKKAQPCVDTYLGLVAQKARSTWRKLPPQHKAWIDIEDLIQDGVLFARCAFPKYNRRKGKFSTYLYTALDNFYNNILAACCRHKRHDCTVVALSDVLFHNDDDAPSGRECLDELRAGLGGWDKAHKEAESVDALVKVICAASPVLRHYLNHWLFVRGDVHCRGPKFTVAKGELLVLAEKYGFGRDDFEFLLQNETWRRALQPIQRRLLD